MNFEEVLPDMRNGKIVKSRSLNYGLAFRYESFGCVDEDDKVMIARVDEDGKTICYSGLEAEDLYKNDYEVI